MTTDGGGSATFGVELATSLPEGALVEATATDADGSTSELSPAAVMPAPPTPADPPQEPGDDGTPPTGGQPPAGGQPPTGEQPPATPAVVLPPAPTPPAPPSTGGDRGGRGASATGGAPRLRLSQSASRARVRAGQTVTFTIALVNSGRGPARAVRVCSTLPSGLADLGSRPRGTVSQGRRCWNMGTLAAGRRATFTLRARALNGAGGIRGVRASATARGVRTSTATRAVRVIAGDTGRGGGVTG